MKGFSIAIVYSTWTKKHSRVQMSSNEPNVLLEKMNRVPFALKLKFCHRQMAIFCWCILNRSAMKFVTPIFALILKPCTFDIDAHNVFSKVVVHKVFLWVASCVQSLFVGVHFTKSFKKGLCLPQVQKPIPSTSMVWRIVWFFYVYSSYLNTYLVTFIVLQVVSSSHTWLINYDNCHKC
jgi:hypothetical protein